MSFTKVQWRIGSANFRSELLRVEEIASQITKEWSTLIQTLAPRRSRSDLERRSSAGLN